MKVNLQTNDQATIVATVEVPDFPNNPAIVGWQSRYFVAEYGFGLNSTNYVEQTFLNVSPKSPID